jgi:hypothetical protein
VDLGSAIVTRTGIGVLGTVPLSNSIGLLRNQYFLYMYQYIYPHTCAIGNVFVESGDHSDVDSCLYRYIVVYHDNRTGILELIYKLETKFVILNTGLIYCVELWLPILCARVTFLIL